RTPRHALSRAASPARSVRVARSRRSLAPQATRQPFMRWLLVSSEGLRPSDFPTRSLPPPLKLRRDRSRGSLAALARAAGNSSAIYEIGCRIAAAVTARFLAETAEAAEIHWFSSLLTRLCVLRVSARVRDVTGEG